MDFKAHFEFRSGTIDVNLTGTDLKAVLSSGGFAEILKRFGEFIATMQISTMNKTEPADPV